MNENCFRCKVSEMMDYVRMFLDKDAAPDWVAILKLKERGVPLQSIGVMDDQYEQMVLGSAVWSYEVKDDGLAELRLDRIQVDECWRRKCIGSTMMAMLITAARYYQVRRITGMISGDKFLWYWYAKLGFTIHDQNQLLMEFEYRRLETRPRKARSPAPLTVFAGEAICSPSHYSNFTTGCQR